MNPDPGADGQTPGLDNEDYWYPLYEKAEELGAVLMVHASISRDPRVWNIPQNYQINNVIGVDPELYEYLLMVDADTCVREDSLNRLVASCAKRADGQHLGLASGKQPRAVSAGQNADLDATRAYLSQSATIGSFAVF